MTFQEMLTLERGWNGYDAEPPSAAAVHQAHDYLMVLACVNARVAPSAVGGVGITFRDAGRDRFVYVEFLNGGSICTLFSDRDEEPRTERGASGREAIEEFLGRGEEAEMPSTSMTDEWQVQTYGSGTMIVVPTVRVRGEPHLYIYGPRRDDERLSMRDRYKVCEDVRDYLNGGPRPKWLDDMERVNEEQAISLDGTSIDAVGPMIDRNPPQCDWWTDESDEAKGKRARLMDRLFLRRRA